MPTTPDDYKDNLSSTRFLLHLIAQIDELEKNNRRLTDRLSAAEKLSRTDTLTGLSNRLGLRNHIEKCKHRLSPHTIAMLDVDDFKSFNDIYGHGAGDQALIQIAAALDTVAKISTTHGGIFVARYGGEEFTIVASVSAKEFDDMSLNFLQAVRNISNQHRKLTISIGGSELNMEDIAASYAQADKNLYHAKKLGKDRYVG